MQDLSQAAALLSLAGVVALAAAVCHALGAARRSPSKAARAAATPASGTERTWSTDGYTPWPSPAPEPDHNVDELVQRPFRWGPTYPINMGIRALATHDWLRLDRSYPAYARLRAARHEVYGQEACATMPHPSHRHHLATLEIARAIAAFLACKYPSLFHVSPPGAQHSPDGWDVRAVTRRVMTAPAGGPTVPEQTWTLLDWGQGGDDPMRVAGELLPDDQGVMMQDEAPVTDPAEREDGAPERPYRLVAGSFCTAGFWRFFHDKLGHTLRDIHLSGKVPQFKEKLMHPMERFFARLHPSKPVERSNYFFQIIDLAQLESVAKLHDGTLVPDIVLAESPEGAPISGGAAFAKPGQRVLHDPTELSWSHTTNGPEALFDQSLKTPAPKHTSASGPTSTLTFHPPKPTTDPRNVVMRTERQTLRRFPRSGAILFTVRTMLVPLTRMADEPGVPGRLASALRSWPEDVRAYKGAELYFDAVLPFLDEKHAQQVRDGIVGASEGAPASASKVE